MMMTWWWHDDDDDMMMKWWWRWWHDDEMMMAWWWRWDDDFALDSIKKNMKNLLTRSNQCNYCIKWTSAFSLLQKVLKTVSFTTFLLTLFCNFLQRSRNRYNSCLFWQKYQNKLGVRYPYEAKSDHSVEYMETRCYQFSWKHCFWSSKWR